MNALPMPIISLVMPCFNRGYDLLKVLQAYEQQDIQESFNLIAVDDASTDETYSLLTSYRPKRFNLIVERMDINSGPATARNRGIQLANTPLIVFVGDDIIPSTSFIRKHIEKQKHHPESGVAILGKIAWPKDMPVNTLMKHIDGIGAEQFSYYYLKDGQEYDFRHFYTSNISLKRDLLNRIDKWFDTDFQYAAFEDVELAYRLEQNGLKIIYDAAALAFHYHYHNIWTFSTRQYQSGLMACLLVKKHPEISNLIKGKNWLTKTILRGAIGVPWIYSKVCADVLEQAVLHRLSEFEWNGHAMLDSLYLDVLNYFYQKGLVFGTFDESCLAKRIHGVYMMRLYHAIFTRLRN